MATLLEKYSNRVRIAENAYAGQHNGSKMSSQKKLVLAKLLDNTEKFMNEAFDASTATQRSDMNQWKRFCLQ